ncbi:FK506-binding nuclear protein-like [Solanum tuberosum]|uniref:FK506-binding nuclear protein-like n=1 Tax=Solanum tuberosum TaxID=4113 RepID=UPI00073A0700|nr:PREDICTED: FK506-binding nuclear protein-like [Solanum tuberosum]
MDEIDNYDDSSAQATDGVDSSVKKTDNGDEESSRDSRDTRDEDDDPLSLPFCAREMSEFAVITGLNCSAYPCDSEMTKVLQKVKYLKNKIYLKKQSEVYKERGNASYALYGFPWAFLVWIYEVFPHLSKYAKKSLDSPLHIPRLLRWHTTKSDNVVEATDLAIDDDNFSAPIVDDEILPLAVVDDDLVAVDAYFAEEVDEEMKEEEKQQDEEKITEKQEEKMEENNEEKEKEQQEEKTTENEEEEKLEAEDFATDVAEVEKEIDVMSIVMELNGEVGGEE